MTPSTALLLVDYQTGFDDPRWGTRNHPDAETRALRLLAHARDDGWQVVVVRHDSVEPESSLRPGQPGNDLKAGFDPRPGEWLISKSVHSAFIGTELEARLRECGITRVVVAGITTDQCVSTTARMANNLGFAVTLVEDACCCFALEAPDGRTVGATALHQAHIATLAAEFADVLTLAQLTGEPSDSRFDLRAVLPEPSELVRRKVLPHLDAHMRAFIALSPMVMLGSHDACGEADVSPRGDPPGFVQVVDSTTLLLPERPGNRRVDTIRNVLETGEIGLLFLIPGVMDTLRVNGHAELVSDPAVLATMAIQGKVPQFALQVRVREAYLHCARCTHRSNFWDVGHWPDAAALPHLAQMLASQVGIDGLDAAALQADLDMMYEKNLY